MADEHVIETTDTPDEVVTPSEDTSTVTDTDTADSTDDADSTDTEDGDEEGKEPEAKTDEPKKRNRLAERFKQLTSKVRDREAEVGYWQNELAEVTGEAPPRRDQFNSPDDYLQAVEDFRDKLRMPRVMLNKAEKDIQNLHSQAADALQQNWEQKLADFDKEIPDYHKALQAAKDTPMHPLVQETIKNMDIGPLVAYHLAKNLDYALDLHELSVPQQLLEIGRLESRIQAGRNAVPVKQRQQILEPVSTAKIPGKAPVARKDPKTFSLEEHIAWRRNGGGKR